MDFFRRLVSSLFGTSGIVDERVDTDFERIDTHRRSYTGRVRQDWRGYSEEVSGASNKHVMVVVDETNEAKTALLWALSHVVHKLDVVTLLHVLPGRPRPARSKSKAKKRYVEGQKTLSLLKSLCSHHQPEVQVDLLVVEGEEGPAIVEEAQKLQASIVVLGQRKPWILSSNLDEEITKAKENPKVEHTSKVEHTPKVEDEAKAKGEVFDVRPCNQMPKNHEVLRMNLWPKPKINKSSLQLVARLV
ncbi:hypothetical protein O6H91_07G077700 [Diphasiastrum complanatum]|uniref:Uncharacterized protein n=1 Tax=Diphasiastrum complanatum TaxID=34168 RepID=A0ACC2D719_DIPCM|nr:hypothetical protein O6H91_07G077700 [Diphasiastrum complanatum]